MERQALAAMEAENDIMDEIFHGDTVGGDNAVATAPAPGKDQASKRKLAYTPSSTKAEKRFKAKPLDGEKVSGDPPKQALAGGELDNAANFEFKIHRTPPLGQEYVAFTTTEGERLYMESAPPPLDAPRVQQRQGGFLEKSIAEMTRENDRVDRLQRLWRENGLGDADTVAKREEKRMRKKNVMNTLWVDQYSPSTFSELLSSERINRKVLGWIKTWDKVVFPKRERLRQEHQKMKNDRNLVNGKAPRFGMVGAAGQGKPPFPGSFNQNKFSNRPPAKVILLSGPPGAGKTTLAHVAAVHAGYNPIEINASDERTGKALRRRIVDAMQMKSMFGNKKPNCIILDEIDGAANGRGESRSAIDTIVKMIKATVKGESAKDATIITRPIICICNDQYAPVLRPLRGVADCFSFKSTKGERLVKRLRDICRSESIHVPGNVLSVLCKRTDNDIRSCLNTLQFLSCQRSRVTLQDLEGNAVGHKDQKASLFQVWDGVFSKKGGLGNFSGLQYESSRILNGIHENYLKMRYTDPNFERTLEALSWMQIGERSRNGEYFEMALRGIRDACKSDFRERVAYPREQVEMARERDRKKNMLQAFCETNGVRWKGIRNVAGLVKDVMPFFLDILTPPVRPVSLSLMTVEERKAIQSVVSLMVQTNLTYRYSHDDNSYGRRMTLEPPLHILTKYENQEPVAKKGDDAVKSRRQQLSTLQINVIMQEIGAHKSRQMGGSATLGEDSENINSGNVRTSHDPSKGTSSGVLNKKRTSAELKGRDLEKRAKIAAGGKHGVLFKYTQGFTNAVRRKVFAEEFL